MIELYIGFLNFIIFIFYIIGSLVWFVGLQLCTLVVKEAFLGKLTKKVKE